MGKLTFLDQQQDFQNAAGTTVTIECDGSVNFPMPNLGLRGDRRDEKICYGKSDTEFFERRRKGNKTHAEHR